MQPVIGVKPYLDDIALKGINDQDHIKILRHTFSTLRQAGVKLKREKCVFMHKSIKYLGHVLDASGLRPDHDKVEAILKAAQPQNREQLESFLGMVQYYGRHVPELSTLSGPLNELRRKDVIFKWTPQQQSAFEKLKGELAGRRVLTHFDDNRELFLATDASEYGVGAVLFHKATPEVGSNIKSETAEQVISYASRTLSVEERNYSQIEK